MLLRGESGTGKELFARAVHDLSARKAKPFIKLNCAALPESVLESELFGHEKGAFTGAVGQRAGRFELAHGGTLLLDEIGEISPSFQAKLLRVLQEGEFERVGGTRTLKVDFRLICATNKNLEEAVAKGEFRADLYYRINVIPVFLPALRERPGDIALLARAFLDRFNAENGRRLKLSAGAMAMLERCYFPGNVRELENCVRRTATLAHGEVIVREDLSCAAGDCLSALLWTGSGHGAFADPIDELAKGRTIVAPTSREAAAAAARARSARPPKPPRPTSLRARRDRRLPGGRHAADGEGAAARGDGARRLGPGQGGARPRHHAAPDRLRAAQVPHRDEALLKPRPPRQIPQALSRRGRWPRSSDRRSQSKTRRPGAGHGRRLASPGDRRLRRVSATRQSRVRQASEAPRLRRNILISIAKHFGTALALTARTTGIALDGPALHDLARQPSRSRSTSRRCGTAPPPAAALRPSCGSSARPEDMDAELWERIKDHPCYSEEAHHYFARMHVAVAPACNIQCNYCNRKYDCANESRPGVVSEKLTPDQARRKVVAVANEVAAAFRARHRRARATPVTTGRRRGRLSPRSPSSSPTSSCASRPTAWRCPSASTSSSQ